MFRSIALLINLLILFNAYGKSYQFSFRSSGCGDYNGTTPYIEEILIGRCHYFLNTIHKGECNFNPENYNCTEIWNTFKNIVVGKDPCDIKIDEFDGLLNALDHDIKTNTSLFWSGTYTTSHEITKFYKYWSLEDTFSGYLFNTLSFCSRNNTNDFDYNTCPFMCGTINNAYWNAASKRFAQKTTGEVQVILNGTRGKDAFDTRATFANYELPYFNSSSVSVVKVILLLKPGREKYETCKEPKSIALLKNSLVEKNITYECEDNPANILAYFCFTDPLSKECKEIASLLNNSFHNTSSVLSLIALIIFKTFVESFFN